MPRVSVRVVAICDSEILLAKYRDKEGEWYVTPGGGVETGETLEEAFHRELSEELNTEAAFGKVLMMREVIADRLQDTNLPEGFHQLEIFVETRIERSTHLETVQPDPGQIGLEWLPLNQLNEIRFYPASLKGAFADQKWDRFYYGNIA